MGGKPFFHFLENFLGHKNSFLKPAITLIAQSRVRIRMTNLGGRSLGRGPRFLFQLVAEMSFAGGLGKQARTKRLRNPPYTGTTEGQGEASNSQRALRLAVVQVKGIVAT